MLKRLDKKLDDLIGLSSLNAASSAYARAEQLASIIKLTPMMMSGNVVGVLIFLAVFRNNANIGSLCVWAALVSLTALLALRSWWEFKSREKRKRASHRAVVRASVNGLILGSLWGAAPLLTLQDSSSGQHLLVYVMMAGMICGGGFALSAMPQAVISFMLPVLLGSTFSLIINADYMQSAISILFVSFAGIIITASLSHSRTFIGRIAAQTESDDRGAVIGMLLKNFEENSSDWLWSCDRDGKLERVSDRFAEAVGQTAEALHSLRLIDLFAGPVSQRHAGYGVVLESIRHKTAFRDIELPLSLGGKTHWWRLTGQPFTDDLGEHTGFRGVASDVSDQKAVEERVVYLAHNDALTGVANRSRFNDYLTQNVARMARYGIGFALLYIDLDQFKAVNDTKGHDVGDRLLIEVTRRFSAILRESDVLARLGGDEFAIIVPKTDDTRAVATLAQNLIDSIAAPIELRHDILSVGVSIGIAMAPADGYEPEQLLRNADLALYRAKSEGRRTFRFFEEEMDKRSQARRALEFDLGMALQKGELELYYQPLMNVADGRPTGFEALIRWNHPARGQISPNVFIPIAEQTGLIKSIGEWVLMEACRAAAAWPEDMTVAVNLSPKQFDTSKMVAIVQNALTASGLSPRRLELEITESLLINNLDAVSKTLHDLKRLGVSIAMDDFGTGYSSLAYLWKFPFDKIKIDRSFVAAIEDDQAARDILRTIGSLGETLNMKITAEGVETEEQAAFLQAVAHQLQGFYFARPIREVDLAAFFLIDFAENTLKPPLRVAKSALEHKSASNG